MVAAAAGSSSSSCSLSAAELVITLSPGAGNPGTPKPRPIAARAAGSGGALRSGTGPRLFLCEPAAVHPLGKKLGFSRGTVGGVYVISRKICGATHEEQRGGSVCTRVL